MKELSVGLSAANAEEAANMGIACKRERRVAFIESPGPCQRCYRPSGDIKSRRPPYTKEIPQAELVCRTVHFAGKIIGNN
jgi:hypothetical protein